MSMDAPNWITDLAPQNGERLVNTLKRHLTYAVVIAAALIVINIILGNVAWWTPHGYLVVGLSLSFFSMGSEYLWNRMMRKLLHESSNAVTFASKLPFWYFSGGIGYALALLFCKKLGIMGVYDTPMRDIFYFGGWAGLVIQLPFAVIGRMHKHRYSMKEPGV